jgi:ATP/ADP translocase
MTQPRSAVSSADRVLYRLLSHVVEVRPAELSVLMWSWLYIFALLSSYYIMRPIRDQMGVAGGVNNLQWLFMGTLGGMLLLSIPFGFLVKTLPRSQFIAITYRFFGANILLFALMLNWADPQQAIWVGRVFFIWISVFNLFVISVFWALIGYLQFRRRKTAFWLHRCGGYDRRDCRLGFDRVARSLCANGRPADRRCDSAGNFCF